MRTKRHASLLVHLVENEPSRALIKSASKTIAPGESAEVELTYQFPTSLEANRKYRGTYTLADEEIVFEMRVLSSSSS